MKKRTVALVLALVIILTTSMAFAIQSRAVNGTCSISKSGNTIYYSGSTQSSTAEPTISVSISLKRLVNGQWQTVDGNAASQQKATYVSTSDSCNVVSGYYYKVFATHYTTSDGTSYSESSQVWIG